MASIRAISGQRLPATVIYGEITDEFINTLFPREIKVNEFIDNFNPILYEFIQFDTIDYKDDYNYSHPIYK